MRAFEAARSSDPVLQAAGDRARYAEPCCDECQHLIQENVCTRVLWCPCHDVEIEEP